MPRSFWTEEKVALLREHYPGKGAKETADFLGSTSSAVKTKASYLKLKSHAKQHGSRTPHFWTPERDAFLTVEYHEQGDSERIAKMLDTTPSAVQHRVNRLGLKITIHHAKHKFWTADREQVLRDRYPEEGPNKLAQEFGKSVHAIDVRVSVLKVVSVHHYERVQAYYRRASRSSGSVNATYFEGDITPDMAWLLGYIWADGCVRNTQGNRYYLVFTCTRKDKIILEQVAVILDSDHKISDRPAVPASEKNPYGSRESSSLQISNQHLGQTLIDRFRIVPRKSKADHTFPSDLIPDEFLGHFLRGYLDGDGSISSSRCRFLGRKIFLTGLAFAAHRVLGVSRKLPYVGETRDEVCWGSRTDLKKLYAAMYPNIDVPHLPRKRHALAHEIGI